MARKKLPKDIDLTKNMNPADGFFSTPASAEKDTEDMETKNKNVHTEPKEDEIPKNVGGRPPKKGLKNEQFTLTMHPELYEKLRIIAQEHTKGNVSALIEDAVKTYCSTNKIKLNKIKIDPAVLEAYKKKQENKRNKKK